MISENISGPNGRKCCIQHLYVPGFRPKQGPTRLVVAEHSESDHKTIKSDIKRTWQTAVIAIPNYVRHLSFEILNGHLLCNLGAWLLHNVFTKYKYHWKACAAHMGGWQISSVESLKTATDKLVWGYLRPVTYRSLFRLLPPTQLVWCRS